MISSLVELRYGVSLEECALLLRLGRDVRPALHAPHEGDGFAYGIRYLFADNLHDELPAGIEVLQAHRLAKPPSAPGAGVAPPARAASSVGIAGELNVAAVNYRLGGDGAPAQHLARLDSYTSRLAIKGGEDLGGTQRATFLLGSGFRVDEGRGMFCNRECWFGLSGSLGALRLGRTLTVYDDVSLAWYFIDTPGIHNPLALWANCGNNAGLPAGCFDVFLSRTARYDSPVVGGWSASASVSEPRDDVPDSQRARIVAAGLEVRHDGFYAGLAHQSNRRVRADGLVDQATTLSLSW
jgi:predicted porin